MKLLKLNARGIGHIIVPLIIVVGVAVIGTYIVVASHAATAANELQGVGSKCLDNASQKKTNGNKIQLYTCNGTAAQKWTVKGTATTASTIVNSNGYCLDDHLSSTKSGTVVDLWICNGTAAQKWTYNSSTGAITSSINKKLCVDDRSSNTSNGNQIQIYTCNGTAAQKWKVVASKATTPTPVPVTGGGGGSSSASSTITGSNCAPAVGAATDTVSSKCGLPDSTNTGVPAGAALTASGSITVTTAGQVISGKNVSGTIDVEASNVTIENTKVTINSANGWAIKVFPGAENVKIINTTVNGTGTSGVEYAIFNQSDSTLLANSDQLTQCTECYSGSGTFENSFAYINTTKSTAHYEDVFYGGSDSSLTLKHDTLLNPHDQTAAAYTNDDFGPVTNLSITNSLLAGGGYAIYAGGAGAKNIVVTGNHFSTVYWPKVGQYGVLYATIPGMTWSGNVNDSTGAAIAE